MKSVLLLNASPFGENARGYQLALQAISNLQAAHPGIDVIERDLAPADFGRVTQNYARAIISRVAHDSPAFFQSERLIHELEETDALIISTPMHNYTVPAVLKPWIDLVLEPLILEFLQRYPEMTVDVRSDDNLLDLAAPLIAD